MSGKSLEKHLEILFQNCDFSKSPWDEVPEDEVELKKGITALETDFAEGRDSLAKRLWWSWGQLQLGILPPSALLSSISSHLEGDVDDVKDSLDLGSMVFARLSITLCNRFQEGLAVNASSAGFEHFCSKLNGEQKRSFIEIYKSVLEKAIDSSEGESRSKLEKALSSLLSKTIEPQEEGTEVKKKQILGNTVQDVVQPVKERLEEGGDLDDSKLSAECKKSKPVFFYSALIFSFIVLIVGFIYVILPGFMREYTGLIPPEIDMEDQITSPKLALIVGGPSFISSESRLESVTKRLEKLSQEAISEKKQNKETEAGDDKPKVQPLDPNDDFAALPPPDLSVTAMGEPNVEIVGVGTKAKRHIPSDRQHIRRKIVPGAALPVITQFSEGVRIYRTVSQTKIYSEPSASSVVLDAIEPGTRVRVIAYKRSWLRIRSLAGRIGYIHEQTAEQVEKLMR